MRLPAIFHRFLLLVSGVYFGIAIVLHFGAPDNHDPDLYLVIGVMLLLSNLDLRRADG